ncbi:phosphonate ABC transporter, inner membrane subunit [Methylobacterium sp. 4-46]|uniref:phosphonate ABC transporter, permease protein PhnE n=1 Tax=unclassified Methylobacterium TaxID=2615210 RepID=UPI000152CBDE|nr:MULTISPECIES: phosphonate ABC transporter, permease protein PhnE [Methylobacterium]ACA17333.1 phosphonate ABC transporter, inner membrane subunit [Methylobacterium sp. 4-46]WFT83018.1 phosphonate ABC transporter, permease protein PhnE [Methylobacterium nodulans]
MSGAAFRRAMLADIGGLRARHPQAFAVPLRQRLAVIGAAAAAAGLAIVAMLYLDFSLLRILRGLGRLGEFAALMLPPSPDGRFLAFLQALGETLAIAFLGTLTAALFAFPFAFLAARNANPNPFLRFATKRGFDVLRSVDVLIWALIWINVVGLGPFAGALAIACSDFGALGKLFAEAIETADRKPQEGVTASGGSTLDRLRFGLLPGMLPVLASQVLYFFESNTRSATIIGIVGAGGIGTYLTELIRVLELQQVAFLVTMILVTVAAIDFVSARLRRAIIGPAAR